MSDQADSASVQPSAARGIAGQIVANASLLIAFLVYMGWAYNAAFYGYFHVNPFFLDIGVIEYMIVSLSLFSTALVIAIAILIIVSVSRTWHLDWKKLAQLACDKASSRILPHHFLGLLIPKGSADSPHVGRRLLIRGGAIATIIALVLALIARYVHINTYVVLILMGVGPLMLTRPTRADRYGRFPYVLAIILAAVCALWAASLYAAYLGKHAAEQVAHNLSARTAVTLYSTQPLALSGPGIQVKALPAGSFYHYRYQGLRLLTVRSGSYYLLPIHWSPRLDFTYIISNSDQIRVDFY